MGGSKGKAPQRRARPGRPASAEQESGSASADGAPGHSRRPARGKAHKTRPTRKPDATAGGRGKPTEEESHRCRKAGTGTSLETQERQGSSQRRDHRSTGSHEPRHSRGELPKEQRHLGEEEWTVKRGRRRKGKERGPSAPRGGGETSARDGDTSGGDGGSSCLDSEHREALDSSNQGGGAWKRPIKTEPSDTSKEGAIIRRPGSMDNNQQGNDGQALELPSREGPSGTGSQGTSDDSRTDTDSSLGSPGHRRRPQETPGTSSRVPESQETELSREAAASSTFESSCVSSPRGSQGPQDSKANADTSDVEAQPKAELQNTEPETAEVPRAQRLQVGEVPGKVQVVVSERDTGAREGAGVGDRRPRGPTPLAALVVLRKLRARAPTGASPQLAGGLHVGLKARLQRVARALGFLRWLRLRLEQRRGGACRASPQEHEERGREGALEARGGAPGLPRWRAISLACRAVLRGPSRAPPGGSLSPPQALTSSGSAGAAIVEDAASDPKFAVVFPRVYSAEKESCSSSSGASTDAPTGEGHVLSPAGPTECREEQGASEEGVVRSGQAPSFSPSSPNGTPPDENRSEAEPETLEVETQVHWAQGATPSVDPELGSDSLLPQLTLETRLRHNSPCRSRRERWEPEDDAEAALERDLELSLRKDLEMLPFPGAAKAMSLPEGLEDIEDLARLR